MTKTDRNTVRRYRACQDALSTLKDICHDVHRLMYIEGEFSSALELFESLQRAIRKMPGYFLEVRKDTPVRHEGLALYCELQQDWGKAIQHRQKELAMLKQLTMDDMWDDWVFRTTKERTFLLSGFETDLIAERTAHLLVLQERSSEAGCEERASG